MSLSGDWKLELDFLLGAASHTLHLEQSGADVVGRFRTQYGDQEIRGTVSDDGSVLLRSSVHYQACGAPYIFRGQLAKEQMAGELSLGEFWTARWQARRQPGPA